jgi:hypothetical protein
MDVLFFHYFFELFVSIPFDVAHHFLGKLSVGPTVVDVEPTHRLTSSLEDALERFEIITSATFGALPIHRLAVSSTQKFLIKMNG